MSATAPSAGLGPGIRSARAEPERRLRYSFGARRGKIRRMEYAPLLSEHSRHHATLGERVNSSCRRGKIRQFLATTLAGLLTAAAAGAFLVAAPAPATAASSDTVSSTNLLYSNRTAITRIFDGINAYRKANGLKPAVLTLPGSSDAQQWTNEWHKTGTAPKTQPADLPDLPWSAALYYSCMTGEETKVVQAWIAANGSAMTAAPTGSTSALGIGVSPGMHGSLVVRVVGYDYAGPAPSTVFTTPGAYFAHLDAATAYIAPDVSPFQDIVPSQQFYKDMTWLSAQGISTGWKTGSAATYRPLTSINRDAMAAFLYRMAGSPAYTAPQNSAFTDVTTSHPFYREISWLATQGISTGWDTAEGTRTFRPDRPISRDAMAAFLYRASGYPTYTAPARSPFNDVSPAQQFYKEMTWLSANGISTGWTEPDGAATYRPLTDIKRDAMAAFLYRLADKNN